MRQCLAVDVNIQNAYVCNSVTGYYQE